MISKTPPGVEWGYLSKKEIAVRCGVPNDVNFDTNGLPHLIEADESRDPYTVFTTATGRYYHATPTCLRGHTLIKKNVTELRQGLMPCSRCCPIIPNYNEWYTRYKNLMNELHCYQIELPAEMERNELFLHPNH